MAATSRVMHLYTDHTVLDDQALPFCVGGGGVAQKGQDAFDLLDLARHERNGKAETVVRDRTGDDVPEFRNVLRRETNGFVGGEQPRHAFHRYGMMLVVRLCPPQQDIRIDQNAHLAARAIDAFAADGGI